MVVPGVESNDDLPVPALREDDAVRVEIILKKRHQHPCTNKILYKRVFEKKSALRKYRKLLVKTSVADPDPNPDPDPRVFGPPRSGSGSTSQRYGSGSFYHHAIIVRKTLIPTI